MGSGPTGINRGNLCLFHSPIKYSKLTVNFKLKNDAGNSLDSVQVRITDSTGTQPIDTFYTNSKGKVIFKLEYERQYRVYFEKESYVGIFMLFDTDVPSSKVYKPYTHAGTLTLIDDSTKFNRRAVAERPARKVYFNPAFDLFDEIANPGNFISELERPNIGRMTVRGSLKGLFNDSLPVHVFVLDSNDQIISESYSDSNGNYSIQMDMMQPETKVYFEGDNVHPVFAEISTVVPDSLKEGDFSVKQDIELVSSEEPINMRATALPVEKIEYIPEEGNFGSDELAASTFKEKIFLNRKRITVRGNLENQEGKPFKPTKVQIKDGNTLIDEMVVDSSDFEIEIPYQSIVKVNFESEGYHSGFISFSTYMEDEEMPNASQFATDVELYDTARTDINPRTFRTLPMAKYSYDAEEKGFKKDTVVEKQFFQMLREIREARTDSLPKGKLIIKKGTVRDMAEGFPVPDVHYMVMDEHKEHTIISDTTDKKGRYSLELPLGRRYYIKLKKDDYFTTEHFIDARMPDSYNSDQDFPQANLEGLPIIHKETTYFGSSKTFPPQVVEHTICMGFYYDEREEFFVLDSASYKSFENQIAAYKPPPHPIPLKLSLWRKLL
ncbi:carboxypeptidase regulatory-like domain-containing protein [bacterium SCSIO 12741]|nr:carboxypeptidase regulatory-like domain-containing protein [bacterium SCSIO 12741]